MMIEFGWMVFLCFSGAGIYEVCAGVGERMQHNYDSSKDIEAPFKDN